MRGMPGGRHNDSGSSFDRVACRRSYSVFAAGLNGISITFSTGDRFGPPVPTPERFTMVRGFQAPLPFPRSGWPSANRGVGFGLAACARGTSCSRPPMPPCAASWMGMEMPNAAIGIHRNIMFLMIAYVRDDRHAWQRDERLHQRLSRA